MEKYEKGSGFFSVYPIARFVLLNVSSTNVFDSGQDKLSTDWWRQVPSQWKVGAKGSPAVCSLCQLWEPGPGQLWAGLGTLNRTGGSRLVPGNAWALLFKEPSAPVLSKAQDPRLPRTERSLEVTGGREPGSSSVKSRVWCFESRTTGASCS